MAKTNIHFRAKGCSTANLASDFGDLALAVINKYQRFHERMLFVFAGNLEQDN
jgi:hypothetical protein